jgi:hypothetical protein
MLEIWVLDPETKGLSILEIRKSRWLHKLNQGSFEFDENELKIEFGIICNTGLFRDCRK